MSGEESAGDDAETPSKEIIIVRGDVEYRTPVTRPGGTLRFAVGAQDAHSLVWRVWANAATRDVYVMVRGDVVSKWSLHASGDWRLQHFDEHVRASGAVRIVDQWERPAPDEHGITRGLSILVAGMVGDSGGAVSKPSQVVWLDVPDPDHIVAVEIVIIEPDRPVPITEDERIVGAIPLVDDRLLLVVARDLPLTEELRTAHDQHRAHAEWTFNLAPRQDLRVVFTGHRADGTRFVWDIPMFPGEILDACDDQ